MIIAIEDTIITDRIIIIIITTTTIVITIITKIIMTREIVKKALTDRIFKMTHDQNQQKNINPQITITKNKNLHTMKQFKIVPTLNVEL